MLELAKRFNPHLYQTVSLGSTLAIRLCKTPHRLGIFYGGLVTFCGSSFCGRPTRKKGTLQKNLQFSEGSCSVKKEGPMAQKKPIHWAQ